MENENCVYTLTKMRRSR